MVVMFSSGSRLNIINRNLAVVLVLVLWLVYTIMQTLSVLEYISEDAYLVFGFLPGMAGVVILLLSGLSREQCYLKFKAPSLYGILVLIGIFIFALAAVLPFGEYNGWDWRAALVLAPAGGIAQELFFRSALLPAVLVMVLRRPILGIVLHSVLFALWHIGPLFVGAPVWAVFAVMLVPFLCGIGWGWQVNRDRTVIWAMVQHSLFWVIGLQFPIPG
jgi:membrane protease YdiL (CAAX protease family)